LNGPEATLVGLGDHHDPTFSQYRQTFDFEPFDWHTESDNESELNCHYQIDVYPTVVFYETYITNKPMLLTIMVVSVFAVTCLAFLIYDRLVQIRQDKVLDTAQRTNAIVTSLFPAEVRRRLMYGRDGKHKKKKKNAILMNSRPVEGPKFRLKNYLNDDQVTAGGHTSTTGSCGGDDLNPKKAIDAPIADLFPNTTVMFADIAGFTAWASVREPSQVFTLLETVYGAFDTVAKRRRVFKVETIGVSGWNESNVIVVVVTPRPNPVSSASLEIGLLCGSGRVARCQGRPRRYHGQIRQRLSRQDE
jgi:hypothetical protein